MPDEPTEGRTAFEKKVLDEAPRLGKQDRFRFACHPGVSCFGDCCGDVNIVLTPYDVLRLRNRLGLDSSEFLDRHTVVPFTKDQRYPAPLIRMGDDDKKSCPFVSDGACTVYEDRPWACRMFPIGYAAPPEGSDEKEFWFLVHEDCCRGFEEPAEVSVEEWMEGQGVAEYDDWGERYKRLAVDGYLATGRTLEPKQMQMFFLATYDLDRFRRFVTESSFLDRFEVSDDAVKRIQEDDEALLAFGFDWLAFSLFGKPTMTIKDEWKQEREA